MSAIKRTPADIAFSKCVRGRAGWKCERCGSQHEENSQGLHCSHYHGRGKWGVRFDPDNAFAHCYGCHKYLSAHPSVFAAWVYDEMGGGRLELLKERVNDISLGKVYARTKGKGDIARHFREEFSRIKQLRLEGVRGRIEFEAFL